MRALDGLIDVFFPPACLGCGTVLPGPGTFCEGCGPLVERTPTARCLTCAEPGLYPGGTCPRCAHAPPSFRKGFAPFLHHGPIARAIHRFKYEDHPELAPLLAALVVNESQPFLNQAPAWVCALPLHRSRFHRRRYDQAELLCAQLARLTRRRHLQGLQRVRETRRQVGLSDEARELNVAGAFEASAEVTGKRLLLVDDVLTTGATARAAAQALLDAGAVEVQVLTVARANLLSG